MSGKDKERKEEKKDWLMAWDELLETLRQQTETVAQQTTALKLVVESHKRLGDELKDTRNWLERLKMSVDALAVAVERNGV